MLRQFSNSLIDSEMHGMVEAKKPLYRSILLRRQDTMDTAQLAKIRGMT